MVVYIHQYKQNTCFPDFIKERPFHFDPQPQTPLKNSMPLTNTARVKKCFLRKTIFHQRISAIHGLHQIYVLAFEL